MDPLTTLRIAVAIALALGALILLEGLRHTFGQKWVTRRTGERLVLFSIELNFVILWIAGRWLLGWDRAIAPWAYETPLAIAGAVLALGSAALAVWAKFRLGRWFSGNLGVKEGHELVTDGPYAITRHPLYTGLLGAFAGAALLWNSALTLGLAALLVLPLYFHTVLEEVMFERHFGEAWTRYRARVPRLVPFIHRGGT